MGEVCKNSLKVWLFLVFTFETGKNWILAFLPGVLCHRENWRLLCEPHQLLALTGAKPGPVLICFPSRLWKRGAPSVWGPECCIWSRGEDNPLVITMTNTAAMATLFPQNTAHSLCGGSTVTCIKKKRVWTVHFWCSMWMPQALSTTGRQVSKMDIASPCLDGELSGL